MVNNTLFNIQPTLDSHLRAKLLVPWCRTYKVVDALTIDVGGTWCPKINGLGC
jgi:hypothetical protein